MHSSTGGSRASYLLVVAGHPSSWLTLIAGLGAAVAVSSLLPASGVVAAVVLGALNASGHPEVRRAVEIKRRNDQRSIRRCKREDRLERANVDRTELSTLTNLVGEVDRT